MRDLTKDIRLELLTKADDGAAATITRLEVLANSSNPTVGAGALALLIEARNVRDDLAVKSALTETTPAHQLKAITEAQLQELDTLEKAIDEQIKTNQIITAGLTVATQVVNAAKSIGQIVGETTVAPLAAAAGAAAQPEAVQPEAGVEG